MRLSIFHSGLIKERETGEMQKQQAERFDDTENKNEIVWLGISS